VSWRVDRTPALDEALGGEAEHEGLRRTAGAMSSLGSLDSRIVLLAIILTGLFAMRRYVDGLYVVLVVNTVHAVERVVKRLEGRGRPIDPEAGYFLSDAVRLVAMVAVVAIAIVWWLLRGSSIWRLVGVAGLSVILYLLGWLARTIDVPERTDSFPSGHAANSMALAAALLMIRRGPMTRGATVVVFAGVVSVLAIGWSRVTLGYHYPTDVIGGWALALLIAVALDASRRVAGQRLWPAREPVNVPRPAGVAPSYGAADAT
jgi:membrane-associated phospholipid phosphatase